MKLSVPYYSQYIDIDDPFWMLRSCGAVCLKMVAEFHGKKVPEILSLCEELKNGGGYDMRNGWVHDNLVKKLQELDLDAHRKEGLTSTDEIITSLEKGNLVIVSVEKKLLEQRRFHMILLVGYEIKTSPQSLVPITYFYYHDSESTDKSRGAYRTCDVETFMNYWRGMAIFISK